MNIILLKSERNSTILQWIQLNGGNLSELHSFLIISTYFMGFPGWLSGNESACQFMTRGFNPWVGKNHGQWSLVGYSPWSHKRAGRDLVTKQQ